MFLYGFFAYFEKRKMLRILIKIALIFLLKMCTPISTFATTENVVDGIQDDSIRAGLSPSLNCTSVGLVYYPDAYTKCICVMFFWADCKSNNITTTTTTTTTPIESTTTTTDAPITAASHPFDPLTPDEIRRSKEIVLSTITDSNNVIFNLITLKEPPKADILEYCLNNVNPPRSSYARKAFVIIIYLDSGNASELVVNLDTERVESVTPVPVGNQPARTPEDFGRIWAIVKADPEVQEKCREAGYPNMTLVYPMPWPYKCVGDGSPYCGLKRAFNVLMYGRNFLQDNPYAHPMYFVVIADLYEGVIAIENIPTHDDFDASNQEGNVVPRQPNNYDPETRGPDFLRKTDKPIKVSSPEGPSYKVIGNKVEWQNFDIRLGFNAREGLILYCVGYKEVGIVRPIFYRASFVETNKIYQDPRPPFQRKFSFDEGDFGVGAAAIQQQDQVHCIGATYFIDGVLNNHAGEPRIIKNAICITERDEGILWEHRNPQTGKDSVVRSHVLVLQFISTIGNDDYIFQMLFYQDGSIKFQVQVTGTLATNMLALGANPGKYGKIVFPQVANQFHQHCFTLRIDVEIDGNCNSVYTSELVTVDDLAGSANNPYGQGVYNNRTLLKTASQARTSISPERSRVWEFVNPSKGQTYDPRSCVGWTLTPMCSTPLLMKKDSILYPMMEYLGHNVWVTKYCDDQLYPGGYYVNNGSNGLAEWVKNDPDACIEDTDIVLWHTLCINRVPRVEDFPAGSRKNAFVWLEPNNFFPTNPGLDVPPPKADNSKRDISDL